MAIPFYENEEQLQQQQQTQNPVNEEIDQVDGPIIHSPHTTQNQTFNSPEAVLTNHPVNVESVTEEDLMAWKILALAMCKALKDHYLQNLSPTTNSTPAASSSNNSSETSTAVLHILPNGQVKPQWN